MGNPKRGRDSRHNLKKMRERDKMRRGLKREARDERKGSGFLSRLIGPGWISSKR